ncbi:MAG: 3'-5' exonuclease, partial [Planctomycetia bacterium]|nr:3'-5' exonuclease [Planctomycetia bacterium]
GALFAVGDPKQSIYRFRGAEVEVFDETLRRLGPDGRVDLVQSYRLTDAGAEFVNHVFAQLLGDVYSEITNVPGHTALNSHGVEVLVAESTGAANVEARRTAEAGLVAERIEQIVGTLRVPDTESGKERPARYADVAILFRAATSLHLYEHALKDRGIPYHVVGGFGFYRQQEVRDVLTCLRVLDNPSDDLHLAGLLRSPLFAVSDEGLYHLRQAEKTLWSSLGEVESAEAFSEADRAALCRARLEVGVMLRLKDRVPLAELLDRIIFLSGYADSVTGQFAGGRRFANLRQLVELGRQFDRGGPRAMGDFIRYLDEFVKNELRKEQAPVEQAEGDVVQVMTIHKAKGLEFPIVIVPDIGAAPRGHRAKQVYIRAPTGLALKLRSDDEEDDGGRRNKVVAYLLAKRDDDAADRRERMRTFYVAATRAKEYLILSANSEIEKGSWLSELQGILPLEIESGESEAPYGRGWKLRLNVARPGRA